MGNEKEVSEIKIERSFKVEKGLIYFIVAILCLFFVLIVLLFFGFIYLTKPDVLLSPPTIDSFLMSVNNSYGVIVGDKASVEEVDLINGFVLGFGDLMVLRGSESFNDGLLIMGVGESFENVPYLEYLGDNDSIVIYDFERDSLYVYSKDLESLREVLGMLGSDVENLEYFSMKINKGIVEELVV